MNPGLESHFDYSNDIGTPYEKAAVLTMYVGVTPLQMYFNIMGAYFREGIPYTGLNGDKAVIVDMESRDKENKTFPNIRLASNCTICQEELYYEGDFKSYSTCVSRVNDSLPPKVERVMPG